MFETLPQNRHTQTKKHPKHPLQPSPCPTLPASTPKRKTKKKTHPSSPTESTTRRNQRRNPQKRLVGKKQKHTKKQESKKNGRKKHTKNKKKKTTPPPNKKKKTPHPDRPKWHSWSGGNKSSQRPSSNSPTSAAAKLRGLTPRISAEVAQALGIWFEFGVSFLGGWFHFWCFCWFRVNFWAFVSSLG